MSILLCNKCSTEQFKVPNSVYNILSMILTSIEFLSYDKSTNLSEIVKFYNHIKLRFECY